jgi:ABC-type phosphate transport system substrate-binding protein
LRVNQRFASVALGLLLAPAAGAPETSVKVVAHPTVPGTQVRKETLADVFLGRASRLANGEAIVPVDQSARSPVRAAFSASVLSRSVAAVQAHWFREISNRRRPPITRGSDGEVLEFVAATRGAIGYVAASTAIDASVKEMQVIP